MTVINEKFSVSTKGFNDIIDLTQKVRSMIYCHNVKDACVSVSVIGSTAGMTFIEYEPGLLKDLPETFEELAPINKRYYHNDTWHDGNGYAHIRSALLGNSITIPVINGELELGTWQQAILIDFDNKPRTRTIVVQIIT